MTSKKNFDIFKSSAEPPPFYFLNVTKIRRLRIIFGIFQQKNCHERHYFWHIVTHIVIGILKICQGVQKLGIFSHGVQILDKKIKFLADMTSLLLSWKMELAKN